MITSTGRIAHASLILPRYSHSPLIESISGMTIQIREKINYNGVLKEIDSMPWIDFKNPNIIPNNNLLEHCHSSACWRGYIGSWLIKDEKLYLTKIAGKFKMLNDEPLFSEWYTGSFVIHEKITVLNYREIQDTYDNIKIEFKEGIVISSTRIEILSNIM